MIRPGTDVHCAFWQAKFSGCQGVMFGALDGTAPKLMLLARSPGIDRAIACKCKNMIGPTCKLYNIFEPLHKNGTVLNSDDFSFLPSESNHPFVSLYEVVSSMLKGRK